MCAPNLSKKADDRERDTARGGGGGAKKKAAAPVGIGPPVNLNLDDDNDDSDKEEDDDDKGGPLEDVPDCACTLMGPNSGHRIHTACLQKLQAADPNWECPRCQDLRRRAAIGADDGVTYCAAIRGGFKASTKIQAAVDACKAVVAKNEKIIVFSFFKPGLDLVEAALHEEGVESLRFDGDVPQRERSGVLEAFRAPSAASHSAHVLLMTVHSGGTGLNIACANHVYFMDRWFNPQVHFQAIARVHRIGQTKDCVATYADAVDTIDEAMAEARSRVTW